MQQCQKQQKNKYGEIKLTSYLFLVTKAHKSEHLLSRHGESYDMTLTITVLAIPVSENKVSEGMHVNVIFRSHP